MGDLTKVPIVLTAILTAARTTKGFYGTVLYFWTLSIVICFILEYYLNGWTFLVREYCKQHEVFIESFLVYIYRLLLAQEKFELNLSKAFIIYQILEIKGGNYNFILVGVNIVCFRP